MTDAVIHHANALKGNAPKRLLRAAEDIVGNDLTRYQSAVRSWTEGDKRTADEWTETRLRRVRRQVRFLTRA